MKIKNDGSNYISRIRVRDAGFFLYLSFFGKLKCSFLVSFFFFNLTSCMGRRGNVRDSKTVLAPFFLKVKYVVL
jgi:hypothetical protein